MKVLRLTIVLNELIRVSEAAKPLLCKVRFEVIAAVYRDGFGVRIRDDAIPPDKPLAGSVLLRHPVAYLCETYMSHLEGEEVVESE